LTLFVNFYSNYVANRSSIRLFLSIADFLIWLSLPNQSYVFVYIDLGGVHLTELAYSIRQELVLTTKDIEVFQLPTHQI
jgi:hypothetical protein